MEQNRTLMIIISVAVFLAAIVGVGVALLYPRNSGDGTVVSGGNVQEFDPIEYVRRPDAAPLEETQDENEPVIIVYGAEDGEPNATAEEPVAAPPEVRTENPPASTPAEEPASVVAVTPQPRTFGPTGPQPVASTSAPVERAAPQPQTERVTEYWIQLIASPSRDRVEQAMESLEEMSLGGRITTREVDDTVYYRLRVGPYQNRAEAEKFLEWIREIDRFAEAYISEEYPLRTLGG